MQLTVIFRMHYRGYFREVRTEMSRQRETQRGRVQFSVQLQTVSVRAEFCRARVRAQIYRVRVRDQTIRVRDRDQIVRDREQ